MKKFKLRFPKARVDDFVNLSIQLDIRVIISWQEEEGDFLGFTNTEHLVAICAMPDDKVETFKANDFFKFVKQQ